MPRLLIIGGTGEARHLANAVAALYGPRLKLVTSRLGLVPAAGPVAGDMRQGGFGGVSGLMDYFKQENIDWVIDASHPFAATISRNTRMACRETGRDYLRIERPSWRVPVGKKWRLFAECEELCAAIPDGARRCFLTVGAVGAAAFAAVYRRQKEHNRRPVPNRYWLIRVVCPPDDHERTAWQAAFGPLLSPFVIRPSRPGINRQGGFALWVQRGPFTFNREMALLRQFGIDCLIAKMSGGPATRAKLVAADHLKIPCLLLERPTGLESTSFENGGAVSGVAAALDWLAQRCPRSGKNVIDKRC